MSRRIRAEWILLASTVCVTFLAGEVFARLLTPKELPKRGYAPIRDARATKPENGLGYRDVDHVAGKRPGVRRALFLGDSFTYGQGVLFEDAFPRRVERLLTESRREPWETIVIAIPGIGTAREARLLERDGFAYEPDVVVLGYVLNDGEDHDAGEIRRAREWQEAEERRALAPWWSRSVFLSFIGARVRATRQNRAREENYKRLFEEGSSGFAGSREALLRIGATLRERNIPWVIAIFPLFANALDENYPFSRAHETVAAAGRAAGASVVLDLLPAYRDMNWRILVVEGEDDEHPSELAHRIAADAIAPAIDRLFPGR